MDSLLEIQLYDLFRACTGGVSTDSRYIPTDSIFFGLRGERFDGNQFALDALSKGARYAVVDDATLPPHPQIVCVPDALKALQALARQYRLALNIPVVAIGGSNGKTTTKELTARVLATKYRTFATPGNLNNHIGLPLSILQMPADTQIAVLELGANHAHETTALCHIAAPTHGVVTNIGLDHLEGFGSVEGVARANGELYDYLASHTGVAFVNTTEDWLVQLSAAVRERITYPQATDTIALECLPSDFFVRYRSSQAVYDSQLFGTYNFANIATAFAIGRYFGIAEAHIAQAIAQYAPSNNRSQVIHQGSNVVLMDAYNANPSSVEKALASLAALPTAQRKIVILGDMLELGAYSAEAHARVGQWLTQYAFDTVILFGAAYQAALAHCPKAYYFTDKFSLHNWLRDKAFRDSYILIKGSRGMKLETVLGFL